MSLSDKISLFSVIVALIIGIASIVISVFSLMQNSRMIEGQTRAYVCVYGEITCFQDPHYYVIIKNFGNSAALIENMVITPAIKVQSGDRIPFQNLVDTSIAPGQSFRCIMDVQELNGGPLNFRIVYKSNGKTYNEESVLRPNAHFDQYLQRASSKNKELQIISYTLQDFVEKQL